MSRNKFSASHKDAVLDLLQELSIHQVHVTYDGDYTYKDRASDFMAVFNGTSTQEQGRRVLLQILQMCDRPADLRDAEHMGTMAFKNGMRRVGDEIKLCFVPKERVTVEKQTSEVKNDVDDGR